MSAPGRRRRGWAGAARGARSDAVERRRARGARRRRRRDAQAEPSAWPPRSARPRRAARRRRTARASRSPTRALSSSRGALRRRRGRRRSRRSGRRAGRPPPGTGWSAGRSRPRRRAPGRPPRRRGGCAGPGPVVGSSRNSTCGRDDQAHRQVEPAPHAAAVGARRGGRRPRRGRSARAARRRGRLRPPAQPGHHPQVLGAGEDAVDGRLLRGEADRGAHRVAVRDDVVAGDAGGAAVGREQRARMRTVVVLPAPLGPSSANTSPASTARSSPSSTRVSPNAFVRPCASIVYAIHISVRHTLRRMARGLTVELVVAAAIELADEDGPGRGVDGARWPSAAGSRRCRSTGTSRARTSSCGGCSTTALGTAPAFEIPDWRAGPGALGARDARAAARAPVGDRRPDHRHARRPHASSPGSTAAWRRWTGPGWTTARRPTSCCCSTATCSGPRGWRFQVAGRAARAAGPGRARPRARCPFLRARARGGRVRGRAHRRTRTSQFGLERVLDGIGALIARRA